jgi:hypothetical protein
MIECSTAEYKTLTKVSLSPFWGLIQRTGGVPRGLKPPSWAVPNGANPALQVSCHTTGI